MPACGPGCSGSRSPAVGFNVTFTANNLTTPRVEIRLSVTVHIDILFVTISKTATFSLGWLQLPEPVFLASNANGPDAGCYDHDDSTGCGQNSGWDPDWATTHSGDGTLYLNVGSRADRRNISRPRPTRCITSATAATTIRAVTSPRSPPSAVPTSTPTWPASTPRASAPATTSSTSIRRSLCRCRSTWAPTTTSSPTPVPTPSTTINGGGGDDYISFTGTVANGGLVRIDGGDESHDNGADGLPGTDDDISPRRLHRRVAQQRRQHRRRRR